MCQARERSKSVRKWNWDGDFVVHECIVPSSRNVAGTRRTYDIDVREFLVSSRNEVIRRTLRRDLPRYVASLPGGSWDCFESREPGAFDYRARVLSGFVADHIEYRASAHDAWRFPDETLAIRSGDCEDRALLLASLLLAAGISSFHVRVVLGQVRVRRTDGEHLNDHVWVMYKNEQGRWTVLDPPSATTRSDIVTARVDAPTEGDATELTYEPVFLFNDVHLWAVRGRHGTADFREHVRREWNRLDPRFIGEVHLSIIEKALGGVAPDVMQQFSRRFHRAVLGLFGPIVDDIDRRPYDPVEHFDNGYILEGWQRVHGHLEAFRRDNWAELDRFGLAAHAIADFYAHSSYAHFHDQQFDADAFLADPVGHQESLGLAYRSGDFDLRRARFSVNRYHYKGGKAAVPGLFRGQIISGRYAQEDDTQGGLLNHLAMEGVTWIPEHYLAEPGFARRGALPHHNEIAVDSPDFDRDHHKLYRRANRYASQFERRQQLAIEHIRHAFTENAAI